MTTIHAHVAAVTHMDDQPLATVTFQPDYTPQPDWNPDDHAWAGDGTPGLTMAINMTREAAAGYTQGEAVDIVITKRP